MKIDTKELELFMQKQFSEFQKWKMAMPTESNQGEVLGYGAAIAAISQFIAEKETEKSK